MPTYESKTKGIKIDNSASHVSTDNIVIHPTGNLTENGFPSSWSSDETSPREAAKREGNLSDRGFPDSKDIDPIKNLTELGFPSSTEGYTIPEKNIKVDQNLTSRGFPSSRDNRIILENKNYVSALDDEFDDIYVPYPIVKSINIPEELGEQYSYMGWQMITRKSSDQYILREQYGMDFNEEGFGVINGRYVVATTNTFGDIGTCIDVTLEDGQVIPCIIGDAKDPADKGWSVYGHNEGHNVIEFVVDKETWYHKKENPGNESNHPEWGRVAQVDVLDANYLD